MTTALSLRRRFVLATGALLVSQVLTSGLAFASWRYALASRDRQQALAEARVEVAALGSAVREQYVHQAHTYIEGDAGHLHHGADAATAVRDRLERLDALVLSDGDAARLAEVRRDQRAVAAWFDERVAPLAATGALDRAQATALHAETERLTEATTSHLDALLAELDSAGVAEQQRATSATTWAVAATLAFVGFGLAVALYIGRNLANAVLAPVDTLREAVAAWQPGTRDGADELGEIAVAFDAIVLKLGEAETRRLESARLVALGEMSAVVAHELMNPLSVILGQLPRLEGEGVEAVRAEAEHARRIVAGLLGFARPNEQAATRVAVADFARAAVDRAVFHADARNVEVRLAATTPVVVIAPEAGVRQILDNLIGNAIDASPPGSVVEVEVRDGRLEVRDRGEGISDAVRKRLYEPFVTGKATGTGLGLAVCQRIARSLATLIAHEDRPGGGTIASWTLEGCRA